MSSNEPGRANSPISNGPRRISGDLLRDIATGIATAEPLWRASVIHDAATRRPVRLYAVTDYEVWVIGWMPGQRAELHDHGDAAGAVAVVDGVLSEDTRDRSGLRRDRIRDGETIELPTGLVHEIANLDDAPATSIHVYSPPLRTMTRYDRGSLKPVVTEVVPYEPPLFESSATAV